MGRYELLLVVLVACNSDSVDEPEEGRYSAGVAPDAKIDRDAEPMPDAQADDVDAAPDVSADVATADAGTCVRDVSRDLECAGYDGPDAAARYAIACPADDAGNPTLPPPAIGCNYIGWADAGTLTMCCR